MPCTGTSQQTCGMVFLWASILKTGHRSAQHKTGAVYTPTLIHPFILIMALLDPAIGLDDLV